MIKRTPKLAFSLCDIPKEDIYYLLQEVLGVNRAWLLVHEDDEMSHAQWEQLCQWLLRRERGEPLAYIVGYREFMSLPFECTPDVLIPRPETELLVEIGLKFIQKNGDKKLSILDVGTGSGAIAVSLGYYAGSSVTLYMSDISANALEVARRNASRHCVSITSFESYLFHDIPKTHSFDLILSNPPYIESNDSHLFKGDLRFEPISALTDGQDGLSLIHQLIKDAGVYLNHEGWLWIEHGYNQSEAVFKLFKEYGYTEVQTLKDLAGIPRVTGGQFLKMEYSFIK